MRWLFGFLLRVGIFLALALWLAERPGTARIVWHDYVIESSAAVVGITALIAGFIFYLLFRFWHTLRHGPERWRMRRTIKKLHTGHSYLEQGLVAVAGGHAVEAGRLALAARKKLGSTTATMLLQAQAAQLAHDHRTAHAIFRSMIEDPESAVIGYRGLIMEARRSGAWDEVERLIAEISRLRLDMPWLDWITFEQLTRQQDWQGAGETLMRLSPTRLIDQDTLQRHRAALLVAQSQQEAHEGSATASLELAEKAVKQASEWLPAIINLAERQAVSGYGRALKRTVEKGWALQPHRQLADALITDARDPIDTYKQIMRLCADQEHNPVSLLVLAEAAAAADIWGEARRYLMILVSKNQATQSVFRLMAKLERRESGDERAALQWMTNAADAPADATWLCVACGGAHERWQAICRSCSTFATLEWRNPGVSHLGGKSMTPLLSDWSN